MYPLNQTYVQNKRENRAHKLMKPQELKRICLASKILQAPSRRTTHP